jgi:hypothetical protein
MAISAFSADRIPDSRKACNQNHAGKPLEFPQKKKFYSFFIGAELPGALSGGGI